MAEETKIAFAPRLPSKLIERQELVERIEHGATHPLLIVRAAAGGGKSTLLARWSTVYPRRGVWITLDRSAGTRLSFWQRVVDGIVDARLVEPGSVLREFVVSPGIEDQVRSLLRRGLSGGAELTVVLDDFHEVTDESVHDDIHWLLESGTPVRFVIATRTVSTLEDPARMARVDTALVRSSDLAFRRDEVDAVARLFRADYAVQAVHDAFSGWPLPTRAALLQLESGETTESAIERVRAVGDSFVVELLDDAGYSDFLLRTSVAHRLSRELAVEIGGAAGGTHLARAEREGLGTWSRVAAREEFALHPYLRERLEREFIVRLPDEVASARRAYARERLASDDPAEAARQYVAIGDLAALVDVVRAFHGELLRSHAYRWMLDGVDERELRQHPELLAIRMLVAYADPTGRRLGLAHTANLTAATIYARLGGGEPVERTSLLLSLLTAQRVGGHYDQATKTAERLASALALLDSDQRKALRGVIPGAWAQLATTFLYDGQDGRAEAQLKNALDAGDTRVLPWARLHTASLHELIWAMRGDMTTLLPHLDTSRGRQGPAGWFGTYSAAGYHLAEAYASLERFDTAGARFQLDALAPHEATIEHWPLIARVRALTAIVEGTPYVGLQALAANISTHENRPPTSRSMTVLLTSAQAELLLFDGQPHRAIEVLRPLRREPAGLVVRARAHLVLGNNADAVRYAAPVAWAEESMPRIKADALLLIAVASLRLNQRSDAREAAQRALDTLDAFGLRRPLMMVPRDDLAAVLELVGAPVDGLLEGVPDRFPGTARDWALTPTELRVLALLERSGRVDELSATLGVSANTVKSHLRRIYHKLGVRSRAEALGVAGLHGLINQEDAGESA